MRDSRISNGSCSTEIEHLSVFIERFTGFLDEPKSACKHYFLQHRISTVLPHVLENAPAWRGFTNFLKGYARTVSDLASCADVRCEIETEAHLISSG